RSGQFMCFKTGQFYLLTTILRKWSVDCSADHSLRGPEYRLWLKDHLALYGVKNAVLAPGYASLDTARAGADCD
ncbi:MAG: hypothetical protein ACPLXR_07630, partial [Halothiobacillaceae bacterium]